MKKRIVCMLSALLLLLTACNTDFPTETGESTKAQTDAATEKETETEARTTAAQTEPVSESETLKVISYNVQTQNGNATPLETRSVWLKTVIDSYDPDIMGFQEVTPEWLAFLKRKFRNYDFVGEPRTGGSNPGEYSPIFYKSDKYELLETKTFWLSETPDVESLGWDAAYPRVCTYAVLKDKQTGTVIVHMNTHIDHKGKTAKTEQIKLLAAYAAEHFADDYVVLTGDFNNKQDSGNYLLMVTDTIFADTKLSAAKTENYASFISSYEKDNSAPPIDFIFFNKTKFTADVYHVIRDDIDGNYPSDHFGLYGEFTLR